MKYDQYIVKKRFRRQGIDGYINLPYGTICDVDGEFICHGGKRLCAITSQNAFEYFWGYDPDDPERKIERQKLARKLYDTAPKEDGDALADKSNEWNNYGRLIEYAPGISMWQWDDSIFDLSRDRLAYLLDCIKEGERPFCIR